jgi:hypothetical protein
MAAIGASLWAQRQSGALQGPQALAALPDGQVWLTVNDAFWQLDADGTLLARIPIAALGLPDRPAAIAPAPGHRLLVSQNGSAILHWLDTRTRRLSGQTALQWPDDLRQLLDHPMTVVVSPQGTIAVATAGGHRVLVFEADGRFRAVTRPGLYRFTNGLWWAPTALWTTDTNRFALVELDPQTLQERRRIQLKHNEMAARYLSWVAPVPQADGHLRPLASVARMRNGMQVGRIVNVWPDGDEQTLPLPDDAQPQDLAWRHDTLLVVDGATWRVRRFGLNREALPDFGDPHARAELAALYAKRQGFDRLYLWGLRGGVAGLVLALVALAWQGQLTRSSRARAMRPQLATLGTPVLDGPALRNVALRAAWPWLLLLVWLVAWQAVIRHFEGHTAGDSDKARMATWALFIGLLAGLVALLHEVRRQTKRLAEASWAEGLLNLLAVRWLQTDDALAQLLEPGEQVRETFILQPLGGQRWIVLTDRRLLSFRITLGRRVLEHRVPRADIARVALPPAARLTLSQRLLRQPADDGWLRLQLRDGTVVEGAVRSSVTARRVAALLNVRAVPRPRATTAASAASRRPIPAMLAALASFAVPGSAQWLQRRAALGLMMFLVAAGWASVITVRATWVWWHGSADIAPRVLMQAWATQLGWALFCAWDAWYAAPRHTDRAAASARPDPASD